MTNTAQVVVLKEVEHVLKVPSRYVGSIQRTKREEYVLDGDKIIKDEISFVPAFFTLFREVLSNSVDEFIRTEGKFANKIDVSVSDDRRYITVRDNGRGISHESAVDSAGNPVGKPQSVIAFTQLKSGANFREDTSNIGQNGEGSSLTNIFSKKFEVETSDGTKKTILKCKDNLSSQSFTQRKCRTRFTRVTWMPDFERLNMVTNGIDDVSLNCLNKIVLDMSVCYPDIKFTFNGKKLQAKNFKEYVKMYWDGPTEIFTYDNIDLAIIPNWDYEQLSWVNGIYTRRGGSHVDTIVYTIIQEYRKLVEKKFPEIKPADVKNKLMFVVNVKNFIAPRFDSQTKEELINDKDSFDYRVFAGFDAEKIAWKIFKNKEINNNILDAFKVKEELKKRNELKAKEKKAAKIDVPKLIESHHPNIDERVLYIAEGDSALVNFLECRDDHQAAYPLSGKVTNSNNKDSIDLAKSKKVMDLVKVLGLKLSSKKIDNLQYGKIVIFTDADYDGDSIKCLLLNLFWNCWPKLITEGKVFIALSPLIKAKNNDTGEIKYFFDNKSFKEDSGNWTLLEYNKGLGSLEEDEYKFSLNNLVKVVWDEDTEHMLDIAFGRDSKPRKEWMIKS